MRNQNRIFSREYKSRSSKLSDNSFQKFISQDVISEVSLIGNKAIDRSNSNGRSVEIRREAESVFRPKVTTQPSGLSHAGEDSNRFITGRILPCLSQQIEAEALINNSPTRLNRSLSGSNSFQIKEKRIISRASQSTSQKSPIYSFTMRGHTMSEEFAKLSDLEILSLIERVKQELSHRQNAGREKLKEEIQAKLENSGLDLSDLFPELVGKGKRKANKDPEKSDSIPVPAKYRDPVSLESWSGRGGRPPFWVKEIMDKRGWSLEDFKKSGEYEI